MPNKTTLEVMNWIFDKLFDNEEMIEKYGKFPVEKIEEPEYNTRDGVIYFELEGKSYNLRIEEVT